MRNLLAVCALVSAALAARVGAQLADESPFLPAGNGAAGAAGAASDGTSPELRGIMSAPGGRRYYCIYDPAKKASQWLAVNEGGKGFVVKSADPEHNSVLVIGPDGRRMTLVLKEAKVASEPVRPGGYIQPQAGIMNVVLAPTPADEQKRLQAIAEEVRRRRLQREQAAAQGGSGQPDLRGAGQPQQ